MQQGVAGTIEVRNDDPYVISLRDWYAKHKRVPKWNELNVKHGLHDSTSLYLHFGVWSLDEIYLAVLGIETMLSIVERFIREKSQDGAKMTFYTTSSDIGKAMNVPPGRVRAFLRGLARQHVSELGGYRLERYARGNKTNYTYMFTKL